MKSALHSSSPGIITSITLQLFRCWRTDWDRLRRESGQGGREVGLFGLGRRRATNLTMQKRRRSDLISDRTCSSKSKNAFYLSWAPQSTSWTLPRLLCLGGSSASSLLPSLRSFLRRCSIILPSSSRLGGSGIVCCCRFGSLAGVSPEGIWRVNLSDWDWSGRGTETEVGRWREMAGGAREGWWMGGTGGWGRGRGPIGGC